MEQLIIRSIPIIFLLSCINCNNECPLNLTVVIEDSALTKSDVLFYNGTIYPKGTYYDYNGTTRGCICEVRHCIRKCCQLNESLNNSKCVKDEHVSNIVIDVHDDTKFLYKKYVTDFHLIHGNYCSNGKYKLEPENYQEDSYYFQQNGHLHVSSGKVQADGYCIEHEYGTNGTMDVSLYLCVPDEVMAQTNQQTTSYYALGNYLFSILDN